MNQVIAAYILTHFDTISFDIFDTLIERSVSKPTNIFEIVGEKVLGKEHRREFLENRIRAEKKAREKSCEITLDQIYQELVDTYKSDIVELLQKTEVQIELENCHKKVSTFIAAPPVFNIRGSGPSRGPEFLPRCRGWVRSSGFRA